jgi:membrane-bound lytic murein transglycosylase B
MNHIAAFLIGGAALFALPALVSGVMNPANRYTPTTSVSQYATHEAQTDPRQRVIKVNDGTMKIYMPDAVLQPGSKPLKIIVAACRQYGVPPEVLMSRWYQESGMRLGGDRGGAGGHWALATIVAKQTAISERRRWHRFHANHRDILAICAHCGYDCNNIQGSSTGALGPFQFQPSTWVLGAVDADGDGKACPLNLADAAFTAAKKLSNDRKSIGSWNGAITAYAGTGPEADGYTRRAQPLLRFFHKFWMTRFPGEQFPSVFAN